MDLYHTIHEPDVANFVISNETHRLPPVSAADVLDGPEDESLQPITTGLDTLDALLSATPGLDAQNARLELNDEDRASSRGGLPLGQITEVWGPPGVGKTTLGIQAASIALVKKRAVMWVDCNTPLWGPRFAEVLNSVYRSKLSAAQSTANQSHEGQEDETEAENPEFDLASAEFTYQYCDTLAHVIALLCRPNPQILPKGLSLVVVDGLTALVNSAFPRNTDNQKKYPKGQGPSAKRLQVLQFLIGGLQKLAATQKCAILLLSQCATKMESGKSASLAPAINGTVWEQAIATRLAFFKDWIWRDGDLEGEQRRHDSFEEVVFVGVQKLDGKMCFNALEHMLAFHIERPGLVLVEDIQRDIQGPVAEKHGPKRKIAETELEIPDSEGEEDEYGWDDRYNSQVPRPSQWQGSEDLILDANRHEEDENDQDGDVDGAGGGHDNDEVGGRASHDGDRLDNMAVAMSMSLSLIMHEDGSGSGNGAGASGGEVAAHKDGAVEYEEEKYGEYGDAVGSRQVRKERDERRRAWGGVEMQLHGDEPDDRGVQSSATSSQDLTSSQRLVLGLDFGGGSGGGGGTQGRRVGDAMAIGSRGKGKAKTKAKPRTKGKESRTKPDHSVARRPKKAL
ncbi:hypothetical protein BROUX41_006007 [Berkeleyomyces rouxiae]|uniref:uncharacterized protein n=1 Tax=Berkeleyomyces rouxiae TaxID=2035830 RepID=UPI003B790E6F